ncbi:MAG: chromosomal replication initiator protein DnaA [Armatimonadetes bacterium]|nr:chromosomal replication initiator protein DnaA [Armatimonadota bacterium]
MDAGLVWKEALKQLELRLNKPSYESFIKAVSPLALQDDTFSVTVPSRFAKEWLESRYHVLIGEILQNVLQRRVTIKFTVAAEEPASDGAAVHPPLRTTEGMPLNAKYTFDSFVVGSGNRFCHAASMAVADTPARAYNPLFIYGGVGLGKTHLLQAIGHHVLSTRPPFRVVYTSTEKFTNELINAIRDDKTLDFRNKYRSIDVLLIDDIQFLAGKERTQEEFFHTFNTLHEAGRQLVITSDRPPKEIPTLEDRLRSRFEWGLIADIQPPDLETRIAILRKKAEQDSLVLPNAVAEYIARVVQSNIRELEGALIRVVAYATHTRTLITPELAAEALKEMLPAGRSQPVTIPAIQKAVAEVFGIRTEEMRAKRRTKGVVFPRQVAMYLARELTDASLPRIGDEFGGRDHTTVIHACARVRHALEHDPHLEATVKSIIEGFQQHA